MWRYRQQIRKFLLNLKLDFKITKVGLVYRLLKPVHMSDVKKLIMLTFVWEKSIKSILWVKSLVRKLNLLAHNNTNVNSLYKIF